MPRVTLFLVVEGFSEEGFFAPFLAPYLGARGIDLHVPVIGKGAGKGGMKFRSFAAVCEELSRFLADRRRPFVSTFLDYYGLPSGQRLGWDFVPGTKSTRGVDGIEAALADGVRQAAGAAAERFIPYIQMHELEALFYAAPATLAEVLGAQQHAATFERIVHACQGCETIDDSPLTAPSKRLQQHCPQYIKGRSSAAHAPRLGARLDLELVRAACPRFAAWLARLEALTQRSI
ncbi:MAG: DUF4276 family protein [Myxococcales bacterium]|nr:DUF4276 family protein [Myxococcales bacterium]